MKSKSRLEETETKNRREFESFWSGIYFPSSSPLMKLFYIGTINVDLYIFNNQNDALLIQLGGMKNFLRWIQKNRKILKFAFWTNYDRSLRLSFWHKNFQCSMIAKFIAFSNVRAKGRKSIFTILQYDLLKFFLPVIIWIYGI